MAGKSGAIATLHQMLQTYKRAHVTEQGDGATLQAISRHMQSSGLSGTIQGVNFDALKTALDSAVRSTALTAIATWEATYKTAKVTSQETHRNLD